MKMSRQLRQLLARPGIIRSLAPHDVFTARVAEQAGMELLFLGGFGVSASLLGLPDVGLTTLSEMTEAVRHLTERVGVPVIADGDTGHGDLHNVARTVRDFERAGAAGILLEDQVLPKRCGHFAGKEVIPVDRMVEKLRVALDVRSDPDFVVLARTDARAIEGLDAALERAQRYAEAGADMGFVEAPRSRDELARIGRESRLPQLANMLPGGVTPLLTAAELETLGFKIVVDPVSTLLITGFAVRRLAEWLRTGETVERLQAEMMSFDEVKRCLGLDEILATSSRRNGPTANRPSDLPDEFGDEPWRNRVWQTHTQLLLDSYRHWLGRDLVPRDGDAAQQARRLFEAPIVVVAHGTQDDPILSYANRRALELWELALPELLRTPSRQTAEPMHRDERAELLARTRRDGYADNYQGIRISKSGRRFRIRGALIWNLITADGRYAGQAAAFDDWEYLSPAGERRSSNG